MSKTDREAIVDALVPVRAGGEVDHWENSARDLMRGMLMCIDPKGEDSELGGMRLGGDVRVFDPVGQTSGEYFASVAGCRAGKGVSSVQIRPDVMSGGDE